MIDYTIKTHWVLPGPELVDGVEIETRAEREAAEKMAKRMTALMDADMERFFLFGDQPQLP